MGEKEKEMEEMEKRREEERWRRGKIREVGIKRIEGS